MTILAKDQLKSIVERIERLEAEKSETASDIREVYAEAKGNGYDIRALRTIIRMRKQDTDARREQEAIVETYMHALGMLSDTPLGQAAIKRAAGKYDDTKMTITAGDHKVELTTGELNRAADFVGTKEGKRAIREAAKKHGVGNIMRAG
jgi:uncharacterized protein (UPF0335 family)